jgi:hypothetical protein
MAHLIYDKLDDREKKVGREFVANYNDYNKISERMRENKWTIY